MSLLLNSVLLLKVLRTSPTSYNVSESPTSLSPSTPTPLKSRHGDVETDQKKVHTPSYAQAIQQQQQQQQRLPPLEDRQVIFVGGVPRSGTTLVRAMLDAHPDVRCGEETRVVPRILAMRNRWDRSDREHKRLVEAGMEEKLLDKATRAFINTIILGHGSLVQFLCNKDPLVLNYMNDVLRLYPHAKFVLLIRDGRAVAHSIVSRNVTISGVNSRSYLSAAMFWNKVMMRMTRDCDYIGPGKCMELYYEKLVADPQKWMKILLEFLDVPWHDNVLRHQELIDKEVLLSKYVLGVWCVRIWCMSGMCVCAGVGEFGMWVCQVCVCASVGVSCVGI